MPHCTAAVDAARLIWPGLKVVHLSENGRELGKRPKPDQWVLTGDEYIALHENLAAHKAAFGGKK